MTPFEWGCLVLFVTGYGYVWRRLFYGMSTMGISEWAPLGWGDVLWGLLAATFVSLAWPAVLLGWAVRAAFGSQSAERFVVTVGVEPREDRVKRLEREAKQREVHVERLELELGIRS